MSSSTKPSPLAVIFGGEVFDGRDEQHPLIKLLDGTTTPVRVRAMPVRHLGAVLQVCTDEAALLDFVCQVPAPADDANPREFPGWQPVARSWADNLEDESHVALLEAAHRLNFSRAAKWGERQITAKQFQAPMLMKADAVLMPLVKEMAALLVSSLPPSVSPAEPATKSSTASPSSS